MNVINFDSADDRETEEEQQLLMESSDEDEEIMAVIYSELILSSRDQRVFRTRLLWRDHVDMLERENQFERTYRMSSISFSKLVDLVRPSVEVNEDMSIVSSGGVSLPIIVELFLHCFLRYISGGSYIDIRLVAQISKSSFYRCLHSCILAICNCSELDFAFDTEPAALQHRSKMFQSLSSHSIIRGCVGCIDGVLIGIRSPSIRDVPNARDYFSGHYQKYGINVQAVCDHAYRFLWLGVHGPGGCSDLVCYQRSSISTMVDELPPSSYIIGDNAYPVSEHLLTPFSGSQKENVWNDSFNFYLSQVRIKIEQTFGIFLNRWGLFQRPLGMRLRTVPLLILSVAKVHNFVMNERYPNADEVPPCFDEVMASLENESSFQPLASTPHDIESIPGNSTLRQVIVDHVRANGYTRPAHNTSRNSARN